MKPFFTKLTLGILLIGGPAIFAQTAGQNMKRAGQDMKAAGQATGDAARETGEATAKTAKHAGRKVKHASKRAVNKAATNCMNSSGYPACGTRRVLPATSNSAAAPDANRSAGVASAILFRVRLAPVSGKPLGGGIHTLKAFPFVLALIMISLASSALAAMNLLTVDGNKLAIVVGVTVQSLTIFGGILAFAFGRRSAVNQPTTTLEVKDDKTIAEVGPK